MTSENPDVMVIGAGASGCILASRLTEDPNRRVLLLEAGPDFADVSALPEALRHAYDNPKDPDPRDLWAEAFGPTTAFGWNLTATTTPAMDPVYLPRGRVVGGSAAVNCVVFLRGKRDDYDDWEAAGNPGWRYEDVLPYFCRSERDLDFVADYHGTDGPIPVQRVARPSWHPVHAAFHDACLGTGFSACSDHNAPLATGVGPLPQNHVDAIRWSTAVGYLLGARSRANLTIEANSLVHRILFDGDRAVGVEVEREGRVTKRYADEILVCGGVFATPHLLMRSGLGAAIQLREHGIDVVADLPGIGENLRDHPTGPMVFRTKPNIPLSWRSVRMNTALCYTAKGSSLSNDMVMKPCLNAVDGDFGMPGLRPIGFYLVNQVLGARSTGTVKLASADPRAQPVIDLALLSHPDDLARMRQGIRLALEVVHQPEFREIVDERIFPIDDDLASDDAIDRCLLRNCDLSHHSTGTCKMGPERDEMAVVDATGRVRGTQALRVVDASIIPGMLRANPTATVVMLAEKIADAILGHGPSRVSTSR
ncbi:MAG: glucose-methanol-choline oxidoreductase [Deltaproteobacteria bacterium]|nr:glucose-methanol-choline oxidoreductase [Deltaproteobacteria bacterium]